MTTKHPTDTDTVTTEAAESSMHDDALMVVTDHILIRDADTKEVIANIRGSKRNLPSGDQND